MKNTVLNMLRGSEFVSGQSIGKELGVTRSYVWKLIKLLKEDGHIIESKSNKGYSLVFDNEKEKFEIEKLSSEFRLIEDVLYFNSIDSTNNYAKKDSVNKNTLIFANGQTNGRGRLGRSWSSDLGKGIYMSLCLFPDFEPQIASKITQLTALAMVKALKKTSNLSYKIKWPNDIFLNSKKVAGILTEMTTELGKIHKLVIGIGVNVNNEIMDQSIKDISTSIKIENNEEIDRVNIIREFLVQFEELYNTFLIRKSIDFINYELNSLSILIQKGVKYIANNQETEVTAKYIDNDGNLVVMINGNEKVLNYGEISIRL
jgi:BirA family biotin operon repressor/biotin-[acetyl-CoA-carboxylase] ligase